MAWEDYLTRQLKFGVSIRPLCGVSQCRMGVMWMGQADCESESYSVIAIGIGESNVQAVTKHISDKL